MLGHHLSAQLSQQHLVHELLFTDPPFKQCHASTIIELRSGELMAACFGGSAEGRSDVNIWTTSFENNKWTKPEKAATGQVNDTIVYPCWNPVLFQSNSGKLFLFYKVGPSPQKWWGMVKTSDDDGAKWSEPVRLPESILGPIKNKPLQLSDGTILSPSSVETPEKWNVHVERSADDGRSWEKIIVDSSSSYNTIQPSIVEYANGDLQMLCRSREGKVIQSWSADKGKTWSALSETDLINPNSGTDAVTLPSGLQLIIYNPALPGKHWSEGRSALWGAVSSDGKKWKKVLELENNKTGEFSYPAVICAKNGDVHITYTYDRRNINHVVIKKEQLNLLTP